jgi:hypothetical protein
MNGIYLLRNVIAPVLTPGIVLGISHKSLTPPTRPRPSLQEFKFAKNKRQEIIYTISNINQKSNLLDINCTFKP